jgi:regulatory Fis family protein
MPKAALESDAKTWPVVPLDSPGLRDERKTLVEQLVGLTISEVERELIVATLCRCCGNRTCAAKILDISIRGLRNKIRAYTASGINVSKPGQTPEYECWPARNTLKEGLESGDAERLKIGGADSRNAH